MADTKEGNGVDNRVDRLLISWAELTLVKWWKEVE